MSFTCKSFVMNIIIFVSGENMTQAELFRKEMGIFGDTYKRAMTPETS